MINAFKKFILTIISFIALLCCYCILIFVINLNAIEEVNLGQYDTLIVGDSGLGASLNPNKLNSTQNICQNSEPYFITYLKLKYIIEKNVKLDTIIIGFGNHNISNYNEYKLIDEFWKNRMFNTYYLLANDIINIKDLKIDYINFFLVYSRNMFLIPKSNHHKKFIGEYKELIGQSESTNYQKIINKVYFHKDYGVSELSISYLDSIVDYSNKNNITPILLSSPVPISYYNLIPSNVKERYHKLKQRYTEDGIHVIDLIKSQNNSDFFYNEDHLNSEGSKIFTEEVKRILSKL